MNKVKLNLGGGADFREGYENYDLFPVNDKVKQFDFYSFPYPWKDESVDEILMVHILEHLCPMRTPEIFRELHRVLKRDGLLIIQVPSNANIPQHTWKSIRPKSILTFCRAGTHCNVKYKQKLFELVDCNIKMPDPVFRLLNILFNFQIKWVLKKSEITENGDE